MFNPVRRHADPAIQAEIQNIYKALNILAGFSSRRILTGETTFNGMAGRSVSIPYQDDLGYFVSISPLVSEIGFDNKTEIVPGNSSFVVKSTLTSGTFLWVVII